MNREKTSGGCNDSNCYVFTHIPKTAGSTFRSILARNIPSSLSLYLNGRKNTKELKYLRDMPAKKLEKYKLIAGHIPHGIHMRLSKDVQYITFLRDPVDRVISNYLYILNTPTHYRYKTLIKWKDGGLMPLSEFAGSFSSHQLQNQQVRMLCAQNSYFYTKLLTCHDLERAKSILERDYVFGLVEQFDYSLLLFRRMLDFKEIKYKKRNVTQPRVIDIEITDAERQFIKDINSMDCELYDYAKNIFFHRLDEQGVGPNELKAFRENEIRVSDLENIFLMINDWIKEVGYKVVSFYKLKIQK